MRALLSLLLMMPAVPAHAWVAATVGTGCMDRWYTPEPKAVALTMTADSAGLGAVAAADVHTALVGAMQTWNGVECDLCADPGGAGCAPKVCGTNPLGVTIADGGIAAHTPWGLPCGETNADGSCKTVKPNGNFVVGIAEKKDWPWSQYDLAHTVVTTNNGTGEIIDADILFNVVPNADGSKFAFCANDCAKQPSAYPLCLPLTHEMGHVLGMNHSLVTKATMAASAVPTDTYKCQLADDDIQGICTIYRTTCTGEATKPFLPTATCVENAKLNAADATGDATGTGPEQTVVPPACQASPHANSGWSLVLLLGAATAIRLGSGRRRARWT